MSIPVATPGKTRIGWIGTGVMGRWMCEHAMKKGFSATVYNRSADKAQPLVDQGAKLAKTPKEVAEQSDVVFAIVGFPKDVREVFLGADGALARQLYIGRTWAFSEKSDAEVAAVTPAQVNAAVRKHMQPEGLALVYAGDFAKQAAKAN